MVINEGVKYRGRSSFQNLPLREVLRICFSHHLTSFKFFWGFFSFFFFLFTSFSMCFSCFFFFFWCCHFLFPSTLCVHFFFGLLFLFLCNFIHIFFYCCCLFFLVNLAFKTFSIICSPFESPWIIVVLSFLLIQLSKHLH
jgi:hypothetical protein